MFRWANTNFQCFLISSFSEMQNWVCVALFTLTKLSCMWFLFHFPHLSQKFISRVRFEDMNDIKIQWYNFRPYQKRNFRGANGSIIFDHMSYIHYQIGCGCKSIIIFNACRHHETKFYCPHILYIKWVACGVMVIVIVNADGKLSSNPGQGCLHFTLCRYPWERYEGYYSPFSYGTL